MANELSRLSDRLPRARERLQSGAALWIRPPLRRQPQRFGLPDDLSRDERPPREPPAQAEPASTTLVAIHVEVRHATEEAVTRVIDAQVDEPTSAPSAVYALADPLPMAEPSRALLEDASAGPAATQAGQRGIGGASAYNAVRALSAYLTQQVFGTASSGHEPRLLDLRV